MVQHSLAEKRRDLVRENFCLRQTLLSRVNLCIDSEHPQTICELWEVPETTKSRCEPAFIDHRTPAATMVERFFFFSEKSPNLHHDPMILLSGPPSSGKTSLLFQFAFNSVVTSHGGGSAVFICSRRKLDPKPPFLSKGIDPTSDVLDRIHMKYVEDEQGINNFFAAFHMHHTFPALVVIDDLGDFFDDRNCQQRYHSPRGRELAMVRTLALCRNAINHANETGPCMLLFSDTHHGDTLRFLHIYKRWVNSIYTIKGDGTGSYILRCNSSETVRTKAAKYSVSLQYLVLEDTYEDEEQR